MASISITKAADYARKSYKPHKYPDLRIKRSLDSADDVQAHMTEDTILLLPGSNSIMDYLRFNLRVYNVGGRKFRMKDTDTEEGDSRTVWHQGFLKYARVVYQWVGNDKPRMIIGHSLGAAATQVLAPSYNVPGIAFASPRPLKGANLLGNEDKCLSICRTDDTVCKLPGGFAHIGDIRFLKPTRFGWGFSHSMKQYQKVLDRNRGPDQAPAHWP